jgi:hypothetical protein
MYRFGPSLIPWILPLVAGVALCGCAGDVVLGTYTATGGEPGMGAGAGPATGGEPSTGGGGSTEPPTMPVGGGAEPGTGGLSDEFHEEHHLEEPNEPFGLGGADSDDFGLGMGGSGGQQMPLDPDADSDSTTRP